MSADVKGVSVCKRCGAKISGDVTQRVCPACLLEHGLGLLEDELVAGVADPDRAEGLQAADRKKPARSAKVLSDFGDFELLEEIGRGGQGVVYRARQKSLNRTVALKVIGLGPWTTEAHLKRFRREAEAAASLEHPGIVPIHDVGEHDGQCYFSMKFVEGGQLDEVIQRTPMSIPQAVELIAKVSRTVHYAHEHGILHRDIKPGNILLDAKGEPHLTDFGLARLVEAESTITRTLEVMGTPSYMAPEQATGEQAKISKATDVYGLGAVLYQLLTGHPPFAGGTSYQTIQLLLNTEPRQPRLWNRKVDRDLSTICLKCLEKDPKHRYSSALALAEDLEHWLKHEPIRAKPSGFFTHSRKWMRRNPTTALSTTLLVVFAMGLGLIVWNRKPPILIPKSVAVLPFENLSDNPDNAYFAEGIQEEILTRLASIADLKVISRTSTQRYHSRPGNLAEIAKQLGVANILEGSVQRAADQVRVNVQLINAQTDSHLWAETYDRKVTDIFAIESEIAKRIAESLQAKLTGREERALAVKPTNNPEAYDAYLRGLAFQARSYLFLATGPGSKAIGFYEQAVQLDPNFAIAWARLSRSDACLYFNRYDATIAAREDAAKRALENAQKLDPNSPETLLALGYYQYWVLRDYGLAKTTFERISKMLPSSSEVPMALGLITRREGRWDESIAYFEQALALDPRNVESLTEAAETYGMLRQFQAALKLHDRALDIIPNDPELMAAKACFYQAQGNLQEAAKLISEVNWQTPSDATFAVKITQLRLERNYDEAIRLLQARLAQFHYSPYWKGVGQVMLVFMQRLAGDTPGAKVTAEQARKTLERLSWDSDHAFIPLALSQAYAATGEKDSALKAAERAVMLVPRTKDAVDGPTFEENLALIQTIVGDNSPAISTLTQLSKTPYTSWLYNGTPITPALLRLDPLWDPLRSDPAFQKLCEDNVDKSVAVLAFANLSDDKGSEYFSDGISEELLTVLQKIPGLRVAARTSAFSFKGKNATVQEIGLKLGVAHLVEGSVRKAGETVRIAARLTNTTSGDEIWSENYTRNLKDVFAVQTELAQTILEQLKGQLTGGAANPEAKAAIQAQVQTAEKGGTKNVEAHESYLRGRFFLNRHAEKETDQARAAFERAVELDPKFALAWAALAQTHIWICNYANRNGQKGFNDHLAAARDAVERALALEPDLPDALLARTTTETNFDYDWKGAAETLRKALTVAQQDPAVLRWAGNLAITRGEATRALDLLRRAVALDPVNAQARVFLAHVLSVVGRQEEARTEFARATELNPSAPNSYAGIGLTYLLEGKFEEAATAAQKDAADWARLFIVSCARWGQKRVAESDAALAELIATAGETGADQIAEVYGYRNDKDHAFEWLERARRQRDGGLQFLRADTLLQNLHDDPRWDSFLHKMGLADDQLK